ncbi:hypothetical protein ACO0OL_002839 [Hanseniaspora opuntiae]
MSSSRIKYKHLNNVIANVDEFIDLDQINKLYSTLTILYHRNKNQYKTNYILLLKTIKQYRLLLLKVILICKDKNYEDLYTYLKSKFILRKKVLKKTIYQLYNVINNKTFINMALFMITLISDVHNILIKNFTEKIDEILTSKGMEIRYLKENRFRIMKKVVKNTKTVISKEETPIQENVDIGELIEETPTIEVKVESNNTSQKDKKKKKKKKKNLIDDIFSGF